jgi:hypothetical protein
VSIPLKFKDLPLEVRRLVFTSNDDLRSTLRLNHHQDVDVLELALRWCRDREGYRTKVPLLEAALRRVRTAPAAPAPAPYRNGGAA